MSKPDPYAEWPISSARLGEEGNACPHDEELLAAAREAWPRVLAHARRELADKSQAGERVAVAADVWEGVLRAVSRALQRKGASRAAIGDLQSYLIAAFHHRFNKLLKNERKRAEIIELVPSASDLETLPGAQDADWVSSIEHEITVKEIAAQMDDWTRRVWKARQAGYSWKEIAANLGQNEQQAKMRFKYGLEKTRDRVLGWLRDRAPGPSEGK